MTWSPHPITLRQLQYAAAVAQTRNFRRAAQLCNVSQPSLSAQLAQLEDALGVRLFERDRRRVIPTAAGRELLGRIRGVLREADELVDAARRLGDPLRGKLRLGIIPTVSPYLLPALTPALQQAHPELSVVWLEDKTDVLVRALGEGRIDGAILALEADIGDLEHETLALDPFVVVTAPEHPLAHANGPIHDEDLSNADVLLLDDGHCLRDQVLAVCTDTEAHELGFRATSLPTLTQMVASGLGITLLPVLALETESARGDLVVRRFVEPAPYRTLALAWRRRSPLGSALRELAETLRQAYPRTTESKPQHR